MSDSASRLAADALDRQFLAEYDRTSTALERRMAAVVALLTAFASVITAAGHLLGSAVPLRVLMITLPLMIWYSGLWLYGRDRSYPRWMRYVSSVLEVSIGTGLILIDLQDAGPIYAQTAAGPSLYAVSVSVAILRLDSRLCLFAGIFGALQYFAMSTFVMGPRLVEAHLATYSADPVVVAMRAAFILTIGMFGYLVTKNSRALLLRLTQSAAERERVRGVFGMHVSEQVMEHLLSGGVPEGGERRAVTICFTDIRGFTTLSEAREPEELVRLLNLYFGRMCAIVARHGGVVNKFLGDGMLVVFGAPTPLADDAGRALAASREMLAESARMNGSNEFPGLRIGVGLHRGDVVLGNVGGDQRREYTVIGDTVNTAARVQDLTKPLAHELLFTREVLQALAPGGAYQPLGLHAVKGREAPLEIFTV